MITSGDSANLVKIADNLKGLTDNALEREKQNPNGFAPVYMIVSEQQRRDKLRKKYPGDPQTTVAQDLSMASQAYQGKDVLTGIMAGGQPPMMQQPQMASYGGLMGYNKGGIVGYFDGKLVPPQAQVLEDERGEYVILNGKKIYGSSAPPDIPSKDLGPSSVTLPDGRVINRDGTYTGKKEAEKPKDVYGRGYDPTGVTERGFFDGLLYDLKRLGKPKPEAKPKAEPKKQEAKPEPKPIVASGIKTPKQETKPNPFAELLKQEYEFSKKAYEDAQAKKSQASKLAAIVGGLTLAGTGNLAKAGIAGLDAFQGEKDKQRANLAELAKARSAATRGYASGMLDLEKLGVSKADLKRKANKDLRDLEIAAAKAGAAFTKNEVDLAKAIISNDPTIGATPAMNQARAALGGARKPISLSDTRQYGLGLS